MNQFNSRRLVYIMAPSYTGSTLLTFLLANHSRITTIGELKATARGDLSKFYCSCGVLQIECDFWREVTRRMQNIDSSFTLENFGSHFRVDRFPYDHLLRAGVRGELFESTRSCLFKILPGCWKRLQSIIQRNRQLIDLISNLQQGDIFLDGSKDPNRILFFHRYGHWDVKVIYLVRDGRGATYSYMRHNQVPMETAAYEWACVHRECDRVVRYLDKGDSITIHYEDLCSNPDLVLSRIYDFIGLVIESDVYQFCHTTQHILGNQMRIKSTGEIRLDEKWKTALSERDLAVFDRMAGERNHRFGYT